MRDRWWRVLFAVGVIVIAVGFYGYLLHRADLADQRAERQRAAICGILANIPGEVPASIENGRRQFARTGKPDECEPRPGLVPQPQPIRVTINGKPGVIVVNPPSPQPAATSPSPSRTASPRPTPTRSPSRSPHPSPSPTPCTVPDVIQHPAHCLHLEENP